MDKFVNFELLRPINIIIILLIVAFAALALNLLVNHGITAGSPPSQGTQQ